VLLDRGLLQHDDVFDALVTVGHDHGSAPGDPSDEGAAGDSVDGGPDPPGLDGPAPEAVALSDLPGLQSS
jgi:hypothetical protein